MRGRRSALVAAIACCFATTVGTSESVRAQDVEGGAGETSGDASATPEEDTARAHFELGRVHHDQGRFVEAAEEFQQAYDLSGRPELLYNIFVARRDAGQTDLAVAALEQYLDEIPDDHPQRGQLEARLETLREQRDSGSEQPLETRSREPDPVDDGGSVAPYVLMGVGGALVLGGTVTGFLALSKQSELDDACGTDRVCPTERESDADQGQTLATTTDVLLGVGIAVLGTGVVLWLLGADEDEEAPGMTAAVGCDGVGCNASVEGRF